MDIILNPHYPMLLLSALTFVCGWLVIPYRMNLYNTEWMPLPTLRLLTLLPVAAMLLFVGEEFVSFCIENRNNYEKDTFRKWLIDSVPHNYYLLLAVASISLTQAALWTESLVPLLLWIVLLAAFSIAEFYFRFHDSDRYTDWIESWGMDETYPLLELSEELWLIRRKELKAMRRKHRPCHLIIVGQGTNRYAVEITADLDNKLRELSLRKEALLYIDTFPTVREARLNAMRTEASKERMQKLIEEKNPTYKNWAGRDIPFLLNMGANE